MLSMRRAAVVAGTVATGLILSAAPAFADDIYGNVTCDQAPSPLCELGAGTSGGSGKPGGNPGSDEPGGTGSSHPGTGQHGSPGDTIVGGGSNLASCSYVPSDYQPPAGGVVPASYKPPTADGGVVQAAVFRVQAQPGQGPGAWYVWKCTGEGVEDALYRPPVWIPDGQEPGAELLPSPAELAQMAQEQLRLPAPTIAANPAGDQLVNLPTWMWLSGGWMPVSATASVPGVSVTATATPTAVTWSMGDGITVTCTGAGTPYTAGTDPKAASPDCGHVYRRSSASQPGHAFPVTATVHWTVTWSGAGQGGTFPDMTTNSRASFRVAESQALNNGGG